MTLNRVHSFLNGALQRRAARSCCLLMILLAGSPALGAPGDGINLGKVTLSPVLQLNVGFDSNVARLENVQISSGFSELRPSLTLSYRNDEVKAQLYYEHVLKVFFAEAARGYSYLNDLTTRGELNLFSERRFGLLLREAFSNRNYPLRSGFDFSGDAVGIGDRVFNRTLNDLLVEGRVSPGTALDLHLGFRFRYDVLNYEGEASEGPTTKSQPGLQARGKWLFFPKTALLVEAEYSYGSWTNLPDCINVASDACLDSEADSDSQRLFKSETVHQWTSLVGIGGQITYTIEANAFVGYGGLYNSTVEFAQNVSGAKGLLGQAQIIYSPLQTQSLSLGYVRRLGDSAVYDYTISNLFALGYTGNFFGRLNLNAVVGLDLRELDLAIADSFMQEDQVVSSSLGIDYRISRWLTASGSVRSLIVGSNVNDYYQFVSLVGLRGIY